jgi:hypothetical protein
MIKNYLLLIINDPSFIKTTIIIFFILLFIVMYVIWKKMSARKYGIQILPIAKLIEDLKLTIYMKDEDNTYHASLPRVLCFISIYLTIFAVLTNKTEMITPLASLSIASLAAYTARKGIDAYSINSSNKILDVLKDKVSDIFGKNNIEGDDHINDNTNQNL